MVFFVRITVNQSHLRPFCKSTKFNPKIQRTIYLINFQQLRLHVPDFIRTVVILYRNFTFLVLSITKQPQSSQKGIVIPDDKKNKIEFYCFIPKYFFKLNPIPNNPRSM